MSEERKAIPFVTPVRLGNFKVWRSVQSDIEQMNVSDLEGGWQVTIPATYSMHALLARLYAEERDDAMDMIFCNMLAATAIDNGYFQEALRMIAVAYANPSLLTRKDKQHKAFRKDAERLIKDFLKWRKEYDRFVEQYAPTGREIDEDSYAEQSAEILKEKDED